jgi:TRAP transporter TAXI family solute receptor
MDKKTGKYALPGFIICIVFLLFMAQAVTAADRDIVVLGTATPGGGFPVYGAAFAEVVNKADTTLLIEPRNTKGSTENVPLLEAGKLDIALVQGEVAYALFSRGGQPAGVRIIAAMYSSPGMFAVKASSPFHNIRDLSGCPVIFGAKGSGLIILSRYVLEGIGLDQDRDFRAIYLDRVGDARKMIEDGRAVAIWGGGVGWPGFEAVTRSAEGARFIAPAEDEISRIIARYNFLRRMTIPANSYPGQTEPITSVGSWSFVLARPGFPDDAAYRIAQALHRSEAVIGLRLPQARETTMANTLSAAPRLDLIHPGVLKYLRETGMVR